MFFTLKGADFEGYVYEWGVGNSFDGQPVQAVLQTMWNDFGKPDTMKAFRSCHVDTYQLNRTRLYVRGEYDDFRVSSLASVPYDVTTRSLLWDEAVWDRDQWPGEPEASTPRVNARLNGRGRNISIRIQTVPDMMGEHPLEHPFTVNGCTIGWRPRKQLR